MANSDSEGLPIECMGLTTAARPSSPIFCSNCDWYQKYRHFKTVFDRQKQTAFPVIEKSITQRSENNVGDIFNNGSRFPYRAIWALSMPRFSVFVYPTPHIESQLARSVCTGSCSVGGCPFHDKMSNKGSFRDLAS